MSKTIIELNLTMEEYIVLQKALRNYQGKFDKLANKSLSAEAIKRVREQAEVLGNLLDELAE